MPKIEETCCEGGGEKFDDAKHTTNNKLITQSLSKLFEKKNNNDSTSPPDDLYVVTYKILYESHPRGGFKTIYKPDELYKLTIIETTEYNPPNHKDATPEKVKTEEVKTAELLAAKVKTAELLAAKLEVEYHHYKIYIIICKGDNGKFYAIFFIKGDNEKKPKVSDELTDIGWLPQSNISNNDEDEYYNDHQYFVYQYHTESPYRLMSNPGEAHHSLATLAPKKPNFLGFLNTLRTKKSTN